MADTTSRPKANDECCTADPRIARHFDADMRRHATAGTLPPMAPASRALLELLNDVGDERPTLLELGAGSGALSVALLSAGARSVDAVDLSPESVATARRRAADAGVADRASFEVGDGSQAQLPRRDWVVLDRVICCYADVDGLLANALGAAERRVAYSVPHLGGWRGLVNRLMVGAANATNGLRGRPCPGYLHPMRVIERRLADAGFARLREATSGLWYAAVWQRPAAEAAPPRS